MIGETELIQMLMEQLTAEIELTDEQLKVAYNAAGDRFVIPEQICARHILQDTEVEAQDTLTDLQAGADFVELAQERSTGPTGPNGGDLGCFTRGRMVPTPSRRPPLLPRWVSPVGPVQTQFGFHTILVYERQEEGIQPFEQVRDQLERETRQEQVSGVVDALIASSGVESVPGSGHESARAWRRGRGGQVTTHRPNPIPRVETATLAATDPAVACRA